MVLTTKTDFVMLRQDNLKYDVYVGQQELKHFQEYEVGTTKKCKECEQLVGHDPSDRVFKCQHC